jgi:ketosteroid isomerase-like protein
VAHRAALRSRRPKALITHPRLVSRENLELVVASWPREVDVVALLADGRPLIESFAALSRDVDVQFVANAPGVPDARYRGAQGLSDGWRDWLEPYATYRLAAEEFIDAGQDVIILARVRARTHRDGVLVEHAPAAICTVRDGKIVRARFFLDRDQALEAVGLRR